MEEADGGRMWRFEELVSGKGGGVVGWAAVWCFWDDPVRGVREVFGGRAQRDWCNLLRGTGSVIYMGNVEY